VRARIAEKLARAGIDLDRHARAEAQVTPADFAALFPHSRGSLYGSASNARMSAFLRPRNQAPGIDNLLCVGGSTHPGAGVPMVALSAQISCELLLKKMGKTRA
jgi:phytoene dehydrogenase-like protein